MGAFLLLAGSVAAYAAVFVAYVHPGLAQRKNRALTEDEDPDAATEP